METPDLLRPLTKKRPPHFPSAADRRRHGPRGINRKIREYPAQAPATSNITKPLLLNLGCGQLIGPHWINIDSSPNVFLDNHPVIKSLLLPLLPRSSRTRKFESALQMDLRATPWRFASNSVEGIFSSHFFEHLSLMAGTHVLNECFRVLKRGSSIRFLLPSIETQVKRYLQLKSEKNRLAATEFAQMTNALPDLPAGPWWYHLYFKFYDKNRHKMFYDADSLKYYFEAAGFTQVRTKDYLDSKLPFLAEIEKEDRFEGAFCIEGKRP